MKALIINLFMVNSSKTHQKLKFYLLLLFLLSFLLILPGFSFDSSLSVKDWDSIKDYNITIVRGVGSSEDGTKG